MIITHKIRIYPNKTMEARFKACFGYSRYVYNTALELWEQMYKAGEKPNNWKVRDRYKKTLKQEWEGEYPSVVLDTAIDHLANGYQRFWKKLGRKPRFKSKRKARQSFEVYRKDKNTIKVVGEKLYLPKMKGIRMAEVPLFEGTIKRAIVSSRAGKYWVSLAIELSEDEVQHTYRSTESLPTVGVDANIGHFDLSEECGRKLTPLKRLTPLYERISVYQRRLSRKTPGSKKYEVMRTKLQRTYLRIQDIQDDWLHKFTTDLTQKYHTIVIEDLNVQGMFSNRRIAKQISRSLFYRFKTQLTYKAELYGNRLIVADRWYPSTQLCSVCGHRKTGDDKLSLSDRTYHCDSCNSTLDRDYNSACNLKLYAEQAGYA